MGVMCKIASKTGLYAKYSKSYFKFHTKFALNFIIIGHACVSV